MKGELQMRCRKNTETLVTIVFFLTLMFSTCIYAQEVLQEYADVDTTLNIRKEPKDDAEIIGRLTSGEIVTVLTNNDEWSAVVTTCGENGFVKSEYLKTFNKNEIISNGQKKIEKIDSEDYTLITETVISKKGSSEDRNFNMAKACELITGTELKPGEVFSWFDVEKYYEGVGAVMLKGTVGPASKENGFKKAPVIINHKSATGYGGGVCQVSTALFNAINEIGITPLERHKHSIPSSYVKKGMDATVNYDISQSKRSNFVFQNTKDYSIRIEAHSENGSVFVDLYQITRG